MRLCRLLLECRVHTDHVGESETVDLFAMALSNILQGLHIIHIYVYFACLRPLHIYICTRPHIVPLQGEAKHTTQVCLQNQRHESPRRKR